MEKKVIGKAYVLGDNIDTDQIIPAEHLVYSTSDPEELKKYGHYALSSVPPGQQGLPAGDKPFISGENYLSEFSIVIGGSNFGCGSSREQAVSALKGYDLIIIARNFARIFFQNSINLGLQTVTCPDVDAQIGDELEITPAEVFNKTSGKTFPVVPLPKARQAIVEAGGLIPYTRTLVLAKAGPRIT